MKYIKTKRSFSKIRDFSWLFTIIVGIGGLWYPKLGLLVFGIMGGLIISSLFNGKFWCGNICPHGSFFDNLLLPISKNIKIPNFLKSKKFISLFFIFFIYNFLTKVINAFSFWNTFDFLDKLGFVFVTTYLTVIIIGGLLAIFITPRTWCQFCPMGTMQKIGHKVGTKTKINKNTLTQLTLTEPEKCKECGLCSKVCPVQINILSNFNDKGKLTDENCIKCGTCVMNCPLKILEIR